MLILKNISLLGLLCCLCNCASTQDENGDVYREDGLFGESDPTKLAEHALGTAKIEAKSERARTLETYFKQGDYKQAAEMAGDLRAISDPSSEDLDVAEFIFGVSSFYLGNHEAADSALTKHAQGFPQSRHRESSAYYRASNLAKLKRWRVAGEALDSYISRFPESILMEFALYDRALCHFEMQENDAALERINGLESGFVYSKIRDRAAALKGDILAQQGEFSQASASYQQAVRLATKLGHQQTHARSLRGLIAVNSSQEKWGEAVVHYTEFFKSYRNSPQAIDAAVGGLPAMEAKGRVKDGLQILEETLMALPVDTPAVKMNQALRTYAKFYGEKNGPDKLLSRFDNLSAGSEEKKRLHEQIVIARLEVLEEYFPDREAEIRVFYEEVGKHFAREDLSTETLVKLAKHMVVRDKHAAQLILEEALERPGTDFQDIATLERSKILASSPDVRDRHLAIVGFRRVLDVFGNPKLTEEATLGLARMSSEQQDWTNAYVYWDAYLKNELWTSAREEAAGQFEIAKSKAGPMPTLPTETIDPLLAEGIGMSPMEKSLLLANKMVDEGRKAEAFEALTQLIEDGDKTGLLSDNDSKTLRRANILQQDLAVELGMGARLVEP